MNVVTLTMAASLIFIPQAVSAGAISFARDIVPVLRGRCATCHLTGTEEGRLALHPRAAHATLVGRLASTGRHLLIAPGNPDQSYIIMKMEGTQIVHGGRGARTPLGGPPLDPTIITMFRQWIAEGAADN